MDTPQGEVTRLLQKLEQDADMLERLARLVYDDIHQLARRQRNAFNMTPTLQTTAVVHEAFVKLFGDDQRIANRHHLMCLMSRVIRQVIADYARRQIRQKRGGEAVQADIDVERLAVAEQDAAQVLDLEKALQRLDEVNPELVDLVSGRFYAGYTADDLAEITGVSRRTVQRKLKRANMWLRHELANV